MKVKDFIEMLKPCAQDAELGAVKIYRDAYGEEAIDVTYKDAEMREVEVLKDQIESLNAALVAKEETHRTKLDELKGKALNAFLECEGYDEFEREINS